MDIKKSICMLLLLVSITAAAQNKNGLVSGPWAGNVELRNATIWVEVTAAVKNVAVIYHAATGNAADKTIPYKGELGNDFNPVKIELNGLDINTTYTYSVMIDGKAINPGFATKVNWVMILTPLKLN